MSRLFGFECEVAHGVRDVLSLLSDKQLLPEPHLHSYHCGCRTCDAHPGRSNPLHAQEDCTVEGEIITKPLTYGSDEADRTIAGLAEALRTGRGSPGTGAGFHVHVSHEDVPDEDKVLLYRMFVRYQNDLAELASGQWGRVRDYNQPLTPDRMVVTGPRTLTHFCPGNNRLWHTRELAMAAGCSTPREDPYAHRSTRDYRWYCPGHHRRVEGLPPGSFWTADPAVLVENFSWPGKESWLARREHTFEFRLWNSTRAEWRMRLAVGVSVAMVEAAKAHTDVTEDDPRSLVEVLMPFLDSDTLAGVLRQAHYIEEVRHAA